MAFSFLREDHVPLPEETERQREQRYFRLGTELSGMLDVMEQFDGVRVIDLADLLHVIRCVPDDQLADWYHAGQEVSTGLHTGERTTELNDIERRLVTAANGEADRRLLAGVATFH